jgi:hypothetical protein
LSRLALQRSVLYRQWGYEKRFNDRSHIVSVLINSGYKKEFMVPRETMEVNGVNIVEADGG